MTRGSRQPPPRRLISIYRRGAGTIFGSNISAWRVRLGPHPSMFLSGLPLVINWISRMEE
jgi:hypothetical protein